MHLILSWQPIGIVLSVSRCHKYRSISINPLRPEQKGRYYADDISELIFWKKNHLLDFDSHFNEWGLFLMVHASDNSSALD